MTNTALALDPKAIVLLGGINDLREANNLALTPETIANNVRLMLTAIQAANPKTPVLVCEILPSGIGTPELISTANQAVAEVVAKFPQAICIQKKDLFTDTVHLKPAGLIPL